MTELPPLHQPDDEEEVGDGTPRWVKVFAALAVAFAVLVAVLLLAGGHGPGRHAAAKLAPAASTLR